MRNRNDHVKQAQENEVYGQWLLQSGRPDCETWAVTAFFYAAAHWGRAYIATAGVSTVTTHPGFESVFLTKWPASASNIFPQYRALKDESERARYDCISFSAAQVIGLRDNLYVPFRDAVKRELGIP